jgi:hypothetical protein
MRLPKDIDSISSYLRAWASELGERILQTYPPLYGFDDVPSPLTEQLLRKPFPAQTLAIMGVVKRWNEARGAAVVAECGTGKTLISFGAVHVHSHHKPFTVLAMVPPQLVAPARMVLDFEPASQLNLRLLGGVAVSVNRFWVSTFGLRADHEELRPMAPNAFDRSKG